MKRISSDFVGFHKHIVPALVVLFLTVFLGTAGYQGTWREAPLFLIAPFVMLAAFAGLYHAFIWDLADEVDDEGDNLVVVRRGVRERIALSDVAGVAMHSGYKPPRLVLKLRKHSEEFGHEIAFIPRSGWQLFGLNPVARDLSDRVNDLRGNQR